MTSKLVNIGDIFAEEEARLQAEHETWLKDTAAQAMHALKVAEITARWETLPDIKENEENEEDEEDE